MNTPQRIDYEKRRTTFHAALERMLDPDAPVREVNLLLKQCISKIIYTRKLKETKNRRYGAPEPIELDIHINV
jgi:hypothetical protein